MEGRTARRRLPPVVVGGTHGVRVSRGDRRRERGVAPGRPGDISGPRSRSRARRPQRHRRRVLPAGRARPTCWSASVSTRRGRRSCSSGGSPARRACHTSCGPGSTSTRAPRSCSSPALPTRPSSPPRPTPPSPTCMPAATPSSWCPRCSPARTSARSSPTPRSSSARRSTSRSASSTWRRWHRVRPSWPATSAASPRSSRTAPPGCCVHYDPADTEAFEAGLAKAVNELVGDTARAAAMGAAGRERAIAHFGWDVAARRTLEIYESLVPA